MQNALRFALDGVRLVVGVGLLSLVCSVPVQLITATQTIMLKPVVWKTLGEGWEPKNTAVLGSGMGLGMIIARRDEQGTLQLARGGILGFKRM